MITQREMYDLLVEVHDTVAELAQHHDKTAGEVAELKVRVSVLERWRWIATGAAAVAGGSLVKIVEALGG